MVRDILSQGVLSVSEFGIFGEIGNEYIPTGFNAWRECKDSQQQKEHIKKNMRAILQLFNIKVLVFPERAEIKGTIPTQVLEKSINREETATAPITSSPSPLLERGRIFSEEGLRPS